jgi:hypothetical protein
VSEQEPPTPDRQYYSGLDLGQAADYTALAVLERTRVGDVRHYALRYLERFQLMDMLRKAKLGVGLKPINITAGHEKNFRKGVWNVPKKELVGVLQVLLQSRRLKIVESLPDAKTLTQELANFKVKVTASANETFEAWRERDHDDMVLAVAIAAWCGERAQQPFKLETF